MTWNRGLTQHLTLLTGGAFSTSVDPVVAVDLLGNIYISTVNFSIAANWPTVVSKLAKGTELFAQPVVSTNGIAWKRQRSGTSASLTGVAYGNGLFVAGGESGIILTSTNGVNWISGRLETSVYVGKIVFRHRHFLFGNSDESPVSSDCATAVWQSFLSAQALTCRCFVERHHPRRQ